MRTGMPRTVAQSDLTGKFVVTGTDPSKSRSFATLPVE
jgi:hypothetical protein